MISILYVDDEPGLQEVVKLQLERTRQFSVDISASPRNALEKLSKAGYDAVISDMHMPGMNGIEFLKAVRERYPRLPFIIFTGRGREDVIIEALNNGADYYLQKGCDIRSLFADLQNMIQRAVERRRLEDALQESATRYREFFTTSRDAVFITSADGKWIDFNDALVEVSGYGSREEFSAIPVAALYADEESRIAFRDVVLRDGFVQEYPIRARKKDGTIIDVLITSVPVRNPDGSVKMFIGTARDVTEQKRMEQALRESEGKYRTLTENAPIGILTCDRTGQITYLNPKVLELLGSPGEDMTRMINLLTYPPLVSIGFADYLRQTLETGGAVYTDEKMYTSKWGKSVYFRLHISPLLDKGIIRGAQIILDEISPGGRPGGPPGTA